MVLMYFLMIIFLSFFLREYPKDSKKFIFSKLIESLLTSSKSK